MEWKTGEVAKRIGVHPNTVRSWADQYREYMSGRALGSRRRFNEHDMRVLATIASYRDQGLGQGQIFDALKDSSNLVSALPPEPSIEEEEARQNVKLVTLSQLERALDRVAQLEGERERLLMERDRAVDQRESYSDQIRGLERELGELRGKLAILESERRPLAFWLITLALAVTVTGLIILGAVALGRG